MGLAVSAFRDTSVTDLAVSAFTGPALVASRSRSGRGRRVFIALQALRGRGFSRVPTGKRNHAVMSDYYFGLEFLKAYPGVYTTVFPWLSERFPETKRPSRDGFFFPERRDAPNRPRTFGARYTLMNDFAMISFSRVPSERACGQNTNLGCGTECTEAGGGTFLFAALVSRRDPATDRTARPRFSSRAGNDDGGERAHALETRGETDRVEADERAPRAAHRGAPRRRGNETGRPATVSGCFHFSFRLVFCGDVIPAMCCLQ